MKHKLLWLALRSWLSLRAEPGDADPPADPQQTDEPTLDDVLAEDPDPDAPPAGDAPAETPEIKALKRRNQELEEEVQRRRSAPAPAPTRAAVDPEFEREERELEQLRASGATQNDLAWHQWKIDQSRRLRSMEMDARQSRLLAQDVADRADFNTATDPALLRKYRDRVEAAVAEARDKGQLVPRAAILRLLVGDDMLKGGVKRKAKSTATPPVDVQRVDRATPPRARSDVDRNRKLSEREARRARLENQII